MLVHWSIVHGWGWDLLEGVPSDGHGCSSPLSTLGCIGNEWMRGTKETGKSAHEMQGAAEQESSCHLGLAAWKQSH